MLEVMVKCIKEQGGLSSSSSVGAEKVHERPRSSRYWIVNFTVVCLVAKPLNRCEAKGDLVIIQTLQLFKCKLLCYHAN